MSRTTNQKVAASWAIGNESQSHNGQLSTDGRNLYSYRQLIGLTLVDGTKVTLNYRSGKDGIYISQTTSTHVGYAARRGDMVMSPEVAKEAGLIRII